MMKIKSGSSHLKNNTSGHKFLLAVWQLVDNKTQVKFFMLILIWCSQFSAFAQMNKYQYKRQLKGVSNQWHKIILPSDIYGHCQQNLKDIRIFGITKNNDTIEVPYIINTKTDETSMTKVDLKVINKSENKNGYYFTFKTEKQTAINQLKLDFKQDNFDWQLHLQGSQNQLEWYTIIDDYRILSIKNKDTEYQFTDINLPLFQYQYYKLLVKSNQAPNLKKAYFNIKKTVEGSYRFFSNYEISNRNDQKNNMSIVDIKFDQPIRASELLLRVNEDFDYYRKFSINYLSDSIDTEKGWKMIYKTLKKSALSSVEQPLFKFDASTFKKLRLKIENANNQPITIESAVVKEPISTLKARFLDDANFYLTYGRDSDKRPTYDITQFEKNIPKPLKPLSLGKEIEIKNKTKHKTTSALFQNKNWLYAIMIIVIFILGWFSIKMIKSIK